MSLRMPYELILTYGPVRHRSRAPSNRRPRRSEGAGPSVMDSSSSNSSNSNQHNRHSPRQQASVGRLRLRRRPSSRQRGHSSRRPDSRLAPNRPLGLAPPQEWLQRHLHSAPARRQDSGPNLARPHLRLVPSLLPLLVSAPLAPPAPPPSEQPLSLPARPVSPSVLPVVPRVSVGLQERLRQERSRPRSLPETLLSVGRRELRHPSSRQRGHSSR